MNNYKIVLILTIFLYLFIGHGLGNEQPVDQQIIDDFCEEQGYQYGEYISQNKSGNSTFVLIRCYNIEQNGYLNETEYELEFRDPTYAEMGERMGETTVKLFALLIGLYIAKKLFKK